MKEKVVTASKEFKRLNRESLIRIIYQLQKENAQMHTDFDNMRETMQLRTELSEAKEAAQLSRTASFSVRERDITLRETFAEAGSIAEASIALYGVFEAAQAAADRYVKEVCVPGTEPSESAMVLADAKRQAQAIIASAEAERDEILKQTNQILDQTTLILDETTRAVEQKWETLSANMETLLKAQEELLKKEL